MQCKVHRPYFQCLFMRACKNWLFPCSQLASLMTYPPSFNYYTNIPCIIFYTKGSVSPSHTSSSSGVVLPSSPFNSRKRRHTDAPPGPIPNAKLTEVAIAIQDKWKFVGRVLKVNENQITEIERNYKDQGIQEQAYQMLVAWQEAYPDNNYEVLFQALGKLKFNSVARQLYP